MSVVLSAIWAYVTGGWSWLVANPKVILAVAILAALGWAGWHFNDAAYDRGHAAAAADCAAAAKARDDAVAAKGAQIAAAGAAARPEEHLQLAGQDTAIGATVSATVAQIQLVPLVVPAICPVNATASEDLRSNENDQRHKLNGGFQ